MGLERIGETPEQSWIEISFGTEGDRGVMTSTTLRDMEACIQYLLIFRLAISFSRTFAN